MIKKRRKIKLTTPLNNQQCHLLAQLAKTTQGITNFEYSETQHYIHVQYNAYSINFSRILSLLSTHHFSLQKNILFMLQTSWFDYLDTTAKDNANAPTPVCCNKPPKTGK